MSSRLRKHPAFYKGCCFADGIPLEDNQWVSTDLGKQAFKLGYDERMKEIRQEQEAYRLASEDLSLLLAEARYERDFDKLCIVVERLMSRG